MRRAFLYVLACLSLVGCHQDMWIQPKVSAQDSSDFFTDAAASRLPVAGTVPTDAGIIDEAVHTGYSEGKLVTSFPVEVDRKMLERGRERFEIFCTPCHGYTGDGQGMIAQRGLTLARPVATYHSDRLRQMPIGHFVDVMTSGYGVMYPLADRIEPLDRWAIAAYIRVLQRSQNVKVSELSNAERAQLDKVTSEDAHVGGEH